MNFYTHLETSRFKVKNPDKFRKELEEYVCGEEVDLQVDKDGFVIYACNATDLRYQEDVEIPDPIGHFLRQHLLEGTEVKLTYLHMSQRYTMLDATFVLVTSDGISVLGGYQIFDKMRENHYPKSLIANEPYYDKETHQWLLQNTSYKVVGEANDMFLVEVTQGNVIKCPRRLFNE